MSRTLRKYSSISYVLIEKDIMTKDRVAIYRGHFPSRLLTIARRKASPSRLWRIYNLLVHHNRILHHRILLILLGLILILSGCSNSNSYKMSCLSLGTTVEISVPLQGVSLPAVKKACAASKEKIAKIDKMLSIFDRTSPVSVVNNNETKKGYNLNPDLYLLIKRSKEYFVLTQGAFDITVEPLVDAWGFGPGKKKAPDAATIKETLRYVGSDKVELRDSMKTVFFKDPRVKMDFGGVAKGYAVDETVKILKRSGIKSAIVNMGGDLYCLGSNTAKEFWSIGIRNPDNKDEIIAVLNIKDKAVATSGDYENFYPRTSSEPVTVRSGTGLRISGGEKYIHIIDPRTGHPVKNDLRSVTIVADDCTTADALATAVFVMGEKRGIGLINELSGIECFLVVKNGGGLKIKMSKGMAKYLAKKCKTKKE